MPNRGNQKLKLLYLLSILQTSTDATQGLTMPQIVERLEARGISAERKSLYRDLEVLHEAGFDVRKLATRPVQYALVRSDLDIDDIMMLVDVVQSSPFLTTRKSAHLVKALQGLASEHAQEKLAKRVHVQGRIRNQSESVFHSVDRIHEAMQLHRKVEFLYYSYNTHLERKPRHEGKRYVVTPVQVVYSNGNYYLVAYDDEDAIMKTYRIDRMRIAQISTRSATRSADIANYGFEEFTYQSFGMFHGEGKCVTLRVKAPLMDAVVDRFGLGVELVKSMPDYADIRVNVQVSPQFFGWVAGLNGGVSIRAPKRLATDYEAWLQSLV